MRYNDFKIVETRFKEQETDAVDPDANDPRGKDQRNTPQTDTATQDNQPTTPEPPNSNNPVRNNNALGNSLKTLFMGLFGAVLSKFSGSNPTFANMLRTILSGNSNGFDPQQVLGGVPAGARPQVQQALDHVDPKTGNLNNDGTNIQPASSASGWTRITVGEVVYEVGNDFVRQGSVYKTFGGNSAREYAKSQGWIMPPREVIAQVQQQGRKLYMPVQDNSSGGDANAHTQQIFELNELNGFPSGLVWGHKKEVIDSGKDGTRLMGGVYPPNMGNNAGKIIQSGNRNQHGGGYVDYSQGLRPCKIPKNETTA